MDLFTAIIYGLIQGLSEFLPISSSGHLALLPYLMAFKDPGVVFDLCMHVGTALAVLLYFRVRIMQLCRQLIPAVTDWQSDHPDRHFLRNYVFATGVSVICILLLKPLADGARTPWMIAFNQAFFGVFLWVADVWQRKKFDQSKMGRDYFARAARWLDAGLIGASQSLAIFPGVSRSGITLTTAFMRGIDRKDAGAFSFLLSLPIIFAGVAVEIPEIMHALKVGGQDPLILLTGVVVSFVVGLVTIHFFMRLIAKIHLGWFTGYRLLLALVLCGLLLRS